MTFWASLKYITIAEKIVATFWKIWATFYYKI